jgi:hypothetical protein
MRFSIRWLAVCTVFASAAFRQAEETLRIDSPKENATVSGSVEILGTAEAPGMASYRLEFAYEPDPAATWFLIAEGTEPVHSGLLAVWDTSHITEGVYSMRIAAVFPNGSHSESVIRGIRVLRENPADGSSEAEGFAAVESHPAPDGQAAAFPAPTVLPASDIAPASRPASPLSIAFLFGAALALLGFTLLWIRSRWMGWKRQRFLREIRKSGNR